MAREPYEAFLAPRVRKAEPVLQKADAQHALGADGPSPGPLGLRIEQLDDRDPLLPGNDLFHVLRKRFLAGLLPVLIESGSRKGRLLMAYTSVESPFNL